MAKFKRIYSPRTLKVLFALSGNQCAYPGCANTLIEPATEKSDALVTAQICHIYAISENGPRGKVGLTEVELNSPENLVLLCKHHHGLVDGQHETYPAEILKEWKQTHEAEMQGQLSASLGSVQSDVLSHPYFPIALVNQKIQDEVDLLRRSRFFAESDTVSSSMALARKIVEGELSGGTDDVRRRALAWCSRFLATGEPDQAEKYLRIAKGFGSGPEIAIAGAFVSSQRGDKNGALRTLADIDSPVARSASLMVVANHDGAEGAISWLKVAGLNAWDLDSEGKSVLLVRQLQLARWEAAEGTLEAIGDQDLEYAPILHHMVAITNLLRAVPTELRTHVLYRIPFDAAGFPLASDSAAIEIRRTAQRHFKNGAKVAQQLNLTRAALIDHEYELWLDLKDPENSQRGRRQLEAELRDPKSALRLVPLGLQFGIKLDLAMVEQAIDRQVALHGGITEDAAIARYALAFTQRTPEDVANYVARHYEELSEYIDKKSMRFLQIESLSRAGLSQSANECLKLLRSEERLSDSEEGRLRAIIAEAEGTDPVQALKVQFEQTDSLGDLVALVVELDSRGQWDSLCEYAGSLFERTRSVRDVERWAKALSYAHRDEQLAQVLKAHRDLLAQSGDLQMLYCWSLYNEGAILEARSELAKLPYDGENPNHRALQVHLGITSGDWNSLSTHVAHEQMEKHNRSAGELMRAAQLAICVGSPHAKELLFAAAHKGNDDADLLAAAYFLATRAGWEGEADVPQWLQRAAALSDDDGPIQKMTLKDVFDKKPDWDRHESETWKLLGRGDIPMFLGGESLNKSLIDLMLFPALANLSERDVRRRGAIPAFCGNRQLTSSSVGRTIGMDATALLTLSFLDLLDKALDTFETIHVPHSTLGWLFEEKQKAAFHQPSRIRDAHQVCHLLSTDALEKFVATTVADSELSAQVGDHLAALITEAEQAGGKADTQRIVVRPSPVHRISSLMEEEADLVGHSAVLSSCLAVVEQLRRKGQITSEEERRARAYLSLQEKPWPHQPEIADGAVLYLDDVALGYFLHLGLLGKLKPAGFKTIASPGRISEANSLIAYEGISDKIDQAIERIRSAVSSRIESGSIKVGRRRNDDQPEDQSISAYPTVGVIALAGDCDAIISDDRFLNQHANVDDGSGQAPIFSTLDILDAMVAAGSVTPDDRLEYRTMLRRAGYFFVPVSDDELATHLAASTVKDGRVVETAELKAIRENLLRVRMSNWLQLPKETPWLSDVITVFCRVLRNLWRADADIPSVVARSNWILDHLDVRGWAHCLGDDIADDSLKTGSGPHILMLLTPPTEASQNVKMAYWRWVEDRFLAQVKQEEPELYAWIVQWQRRQISRIAAMKMTKGEPRKNSAYVKSALAHAALELAPPLVRATLRDEAGFREEYGFRTDAIITFGGLGASFQRSELFSALRQDMPSASQPKVADTSGREWQLNSECGEGKLPTLTIANDGQSLTLPDFVLLSPDRTIRLHSFDEAASDVNLPTNARDKWRTILSERALSDDEFDELHADLHDTPVYLARSIRGEVARGKVSMSSLVPGSLRYFERLVGAYDGSVSIGEYSAKSGRRLFERLSEWQPRAGLLFSLFLSAHSALTDEIRAEHLESTDLDFAFDLLEKCGDRISQLGAIEVGLRVLPDRPEIEPVLIRLIQQIRDEDVNASENGFMSLSALFVLVDGELSRTRLLSSAPPFYRRLASLSQAALIHRQLLNSGFEFDRFSEWAFGNRGEQYYLQSLTDMRLEPRWNPNHASASQMKADFLGRIMIAAGKYEDNIKGSEIHELILGAGPGSIPSLIEDFSPFFAGPLEGAESSQISLPSELSETIETQLGAGEVGPSSFVALVNSAMIFRLDLNKAELAAKSLNLGSYRFKNVEDRSQLLAVLNGLATVAAVTRSHALADELRILVRRYRWDGQHTLSIEEAVRICLVAAASREDLNDWTEFIGDWLVELAFGALDGDEGKILLSHVQWICHAVPELWVTCGRADAALVAYNASVRQV